MPAKLPHHCVHLCIAMSLVIATIAVICLTLIDIHSTAKITPTSGIARGNCSDWETPMDEYASRAFIFSDRSFIVPRDINEMTRVTCPKMLHAITRLNEVIKSCLKSFPETIAGFFSHGAREVIRRSCSSSQEKSKYVQSMSCIRDPTRMTQLYDAVSVYTKKLVSVQETVPSSKKFDVTYCSYMNLRNTVRRISKVNCSKEATEYILDTMDGSMRDGMRAFDMISLTYQKDPSKCDPILATYPLNVAANLNQKETSFLIPLIHVLNAVGSSDRV